MSMEMKTIGPIVRNIINGIVDVVHQSGTGLDPVTLYALTRQLAGFVNDLDRDESARNAGMTGEKAIELIGRYLAANLAKDKKAIGKVTDEMFCGTLTTVVVDDDGETLKSIH